MIEAAHQYVERLGLERKGLRLARVFVNTMVHPNYTRRDRLRAYRKLRHHNSQVAGAILQKMEKLAIEAKGEADDEGETTPSMSEM